MQRLVEACERNFQASAQKEILLIDNALVGTKKAP